MNKIELKTFSSRSALRGLNNLSSREKIDWPSKEELETLVWTMPTTQLASRMGVSDVAIAKRCKQLGILKPPRGYWTNKPA